MPSALWPVAIRLQHTYISGKSLMLILQLLHVVPPNITLPPVNHTDYSSKNVSFNCAVNGKPRITIQWTKNGTVISNDQTKFMVTNSTKGNCTIDDPPDHCETFSTLQILFVEPPDNGVYKCIATNDAGHLETSANLYVNGKLVSSYVCVMYIHNMLCHYNCCNR